MQRSREYTKGPYSDFELKVAHMVLFQFLRWHKCIFSFMLLKCRILSNPRTSHLSAFHSICACTGFKRAIPSLKAGSYIKKENSSTGSHGSSQFTYCLVLHISSQLLFGDYSKMKEKQKPKIDKHQKTNSLNCGISHD